MAYINGKQDFAISLVECDQSGAEVWNSILANGKRTDFTSAFSNTKYTEETFKPHLDIKPTNAMQMFYKSSTVGKQLKMEEVEKQNGMVFDFSNCTAFSHAFADCLFDELNVVDISKATISGATSYAFYGGYNANTKIKKINRLIFSKDTVLENTTFGLTDFEEIGFEGVIGKSINISSSERLSKASIVSLISTLSATTSGLTLTLSQAAVDRITEEEGSVVWWYALAGDGTEEGAGIRPNWTITLV